MAIVFDGRKEATGGLRAKLQSLQASKHRKLVSIVVGNDHLSLLYQKLKQKACEGAGVNYELRITYNVSEAISAIQQYNNDNNVTGIMLQLPAPHKEEIINSISREKDVDGMRDDSPFVAPVVQAVMHAINAYPVQTWSARYGIMGAKGFVGRKIVKQLKEQESVRVEEFDLSTFYALRSTLLTCDVVISCVGKPSLIKPDMIKDGAVLIDVGSPKPDFDPECYKKASFYTPVPGGIGPLTIQYLVKNLFEN